MMEYIKLKEIADIYLGLTHTPKYVDRGIPFLSVKDISSGIIDFTNCHYITNEKYESLPLGAKPQSGDMLFCRVGTIGKPIIIGDDIQKFGSFVSLGFLRKKSDNILLDYLKYWMKSNLFYNQVKQNVKGVAQVNLNTTWLKEFLIPKKTIGEQQKIINKLSLIEKLIKLKSDEVEMLNQLIKSQFVDMFENKDFDTKILEEFVSKDKNSIKRGPFGGSLRKDDFIDSGYLVYEQRHAIHNDFAYEKYYISKEKYEEMDMFKVIPGDLIISCSGVTLGRIAEVPLYAKPGIINQALLKLTLDSKIMNNRFFIDQFRNKRVQDILFSFSRGSGIPNFPPMNEIKKIKFLCPPIELQNKYSQLVEQIDKQKFEFEKSLKKLEELQASLMQEYFG